MILLKKINLKSGAFHWINKPEKFTLTEDQLIIETEPETDFWQKTYYGFSKSNGHAYMKKINENCTFTVKTSFKTGTMYDQCGVLIFLDNENWVKVSVEHENKDFARLGSVFTNMGFSDWATADISSSVTLMWYRVSIKDNDVYIEYSLSGKDFKQMRMLHLHKPLKDLWIGVYACSPLKSSFRAVFSDFRIGDCTWPEYNEKSIT